MALDGDNHGVYDNTSDIDLDSAPFGQSLFSDAQKTVNLDNLDLDMGQSSLFCGNTSSTTRDEVETAPILPASHGYKEAILFSGNTIKLQPRKRNLVDVDQTSKELSSGGFMNMDVLFSKAKLKNSIKENNQKLEALSTENSGSITSPSSVSNIASKSSGISKSSKFEDSKVWTEKYRPKAFFDLCSVGNDRQYRWVLQWLKKWSPIVYGESSIQEEGVDTLGRPLRKILLVHGPLGIGKTCAVHILAKQLGYNVEELNAANSTDTLPQGVNSGLEARQSGSQALKLKIMNALTTNSLTSNGKPSCLIIDEVDSAVNSNEIIRVLSDLVFNDQRTMHRESREPKEPNKNGKGKKKSFLLNRPIICIANDIYSTRSSRYGGSPMDKLRPLCEVVNFKKPQSTKSISGVKSSGRAVKSIRDHLKWICEEEKLMFDYGQLGEVLEICDNDLRACINHLQFNGRQLKEHENTRISGGRVTSKDSQISWFSMVDLLFKRDPQLSKDENFESLLNIFMNGSGKSTVSSSSTFDKVIKGCFNKYLDVVHYQDDSLVKPSELSDWLYFYDHFGNHQADSSYSSLVALKIWSLFSDIRPYRGKESLVPNGKNLDFQSYETMTKNNSIIKRISENLPIHTKVSLGGGDNFDTISYFLPYLSKIFSPELSSKVKSNLSDGEKKSLEKLTRFVKDFGVKLENERDFETGLVSLQFSPNWDSITMFDNTLTAVSFANSTKAVQLRRQALFPLVTNELQRLDMIRKSSKRDLSDNIDVKEEEKKKRVKHSSSVDFFKGRYDSMFAQTQTNEPKANVHEVSRIWVKYHEGFSNAVRKTIGWDDIWTP